MVARDRVSLTFPGDQVGSPRCCRVGALARLRGPGRAPGGGATACRRRDLLRTPWKGDRLANMVPRTDGVPGRCSAAPGCRARPGEPPGTIRSSRASTAADSAQGCPGNGVSHRRGGITGTCSASSPKQKSCMTAEMCNSRGCDNWRSDEHGVWSPARSRLVLLHGEAKEKVSKSPEVVRPVRDASFPSFTGFVRPRPVEVLGHLCGSLHEIPTFACSR
jgi:hypothetical protein